MKRQYYKKRNTNIFDNSNEADLIEKSLLAYFLL